MRPAFRLCLLPFLLFAALCSSFAQTFSCGADLIRKKFFEENPALYQQEEQLENLRYESLQAGSLTTAKGAGGPYTIPVVVHIIHQNGLENISDAQVIRGIEALNASFANTGYYDKGNGVAVPIQFCLARQQPDGSATNGIDRVFSSLTNMTMETEDGAVKDLSRWNPNHYLNIWLVRDINSQSSGPGVAGYAFFPSSHGTPIDGVVMEARFMGKNEADNCVLTHEIGHYLGLYHTFEGGCTNDDCAKDGDRVCDTPPDQSTAWLPCGTPANTCSTDAKSGFATDQEDMTINYMDYATISCYNAFTPDQSSRMEFFLTEGRASLFDSKGCLDPCPKPVSAAFTTSAGPVITTGTTVNFACKTPTAMTYEWQIDGAPAGSTPTISFPFNTAGQYIVRLTVKGADATCFDTKSDTLLVVCGAQAKFSITPEEPEVGENVTLSTTTSSPATLSWSINGILQGSAPVLNIKFGEPNTYTVCLTASDAFCQDAACQTLEVTDTSACTESFFKMIDYVPGYKTNFAGFGLEKLPSGELLGFGTLDYKAQHFIRFTPKGNLVKHWQLLLPPSYTLITDMTISTDAHALFTRSAVSTSGGISSTSYVAKLNYNTGNPVWYKNLSHPLKSAFIWEITENPVTNRYQVLGRLSAQSATDEALILDFDPATGNLLSQKNYWISEVPLVRSSIWVNDALYGVGNGYTGSFNSEKPMLVKLDPFGNAQWSCEYQLASVFGGKLSEWAEVRYDNNSLVLVGANGLDVFFMKTDLDGQPMTARIYSGGRTLHHSSHQDAANIEVLPDGYLITYVQEGDPGGRLVFLKTDKNGDIIWKKSRTNDPAGEGTETVVKSQHAYTLQGLGFDGDNVLLVKSPLLPPTATDCAKEPFDLEVTTPSWTFQFHEPQPIASVPVSAVSVVATSKPLSHPLQTLCSSVFCTEICDNNVDDDGDGLVDCNDPVDCPCSSEPPPCSMLLPPEPPGKIAGKVEWQSVQPDLIATGSGLLVANLNPQQDNIPEVITASANSSNPFFSSIFIYQGDGSNAGSPLALNIPGKFWQGVTHFAVGDLDGNGIPELVVPCLDQRLRIYTGYAPTNISLMDLMLTSEIIPTTSSFAGMPFLADLDGNGTSEIILGNQVYWLDFSVPGPPTLRVLIPPGGADQLNAYNSTFCADMLSKADCKGDPDCDGLEVIAGNTIYSVDLQDTPEDGDPRSITIQSTVGTVPGGASYLDGRVTVADVDLDGTPDVITKGYQSVNGLVCLYIWNPKKLVKLITYPQFGKLFGGGIAVANVFDDTQKGAVKDLPEILFSSDKGVYALNLNAAEMTPATPFWWNVAVKDTNNYMNPATTFDFNGDGWNEIVVRDYDSLRVVYGGGLPFPAGVRPNRTWFALPMHNWTIEEYGVIADVDNDGQAEILSVGHDQPMTYQDLGNGRLKVIGADLGKGTPWMPTRRLWNQYNYTPSVVNDDLRIPKVPRQGHLELPAGSGNRPLNIALGQQSPKNINNGYLMLPDGAVDIEQARCAGDQIRLRLHICNSGSAALPAGTPMRFYVGNPTLSVATRLTTTATLPKDVAPDSCAIINVMIDKLLGQKIFVVFNDDGSRPLPFKLPADFPLTPLVECNYANNLTSFELPPAPAKPDLGPDVAVCKDGTWTFRAGPGFENYRWSTLETDSTITVYAPGTYWVEATDPCGSVYRDTVVVSVNPATLIELGADRKICGDSIVQLSAGPGFTEYRWYPTDGLSCMDCPAVSAEPKQTTTYSVLARSPLGCFSVDTVRIEVGQNRTTQESHSFCAGDSVLVFGKYKKVAGLYPQKFEAANGCDSTHTVALLMFPTFQTAENRSICTGDSVLVFGKYETTAGIFSKKFQTVNGCDSTHTVTLHLLPTFQTAESRSICAGDSLLIFGEYETTAGIFSKKFQTINGCDSIHTVTLGLRPTFQTSESHSICAGDSLLIFGKYETTAGIFAKKFQTVSGCDSTHTVSLGLRPTFQTAESHSICAGDSTLVFGKYEATAGVFAKKFQTVTGCDSTHTVTLNVLPVFQTAENHSICAGDSLLIFGKYEATAGVFTKKFQTVTGCDSTHTVTLNVLPVFQTAETHSICAGDSLLIFGKYESTAGVFTRKFQALNGCDSTHTITLGLLPTFQTMENRSICAGDSMLIFGKYEAAAGVFSKKFQTVSGCDSMHIVTLGLLPTFQMVENRSICTGDSVLIFGKYEKTAGLFTQKFQTIGGCDSIHTIHLAVAPALETAESRSMCAGDSVFIFEKYETAAGVFSKKFQAIGGCDSTHTVVLNVLPTFQTVESRSICSGDSLLIFDKYEKAAGIFSKKFQTAPGCDSTHTVNLAVVPSFQTSENHSICQGDSLLIFGKYEAAPGVFSKKFQATGGCDSTHTVDLQVLPLPDLTFSSQPACPGEMTGALSITPVNGLPPYQITWAQSGLTGFSPSDLGAGLYQMTVTDQRGCASVGAVSVSETPANLLTLQPVAPTCPGETNGQLLITTTSPGASFSIDGAAFDTAFTYTGLTAGTHTLRSRDAAGCLQEQSFTIPAPPLIGVSLPDDMQIGPGQFAYVISTVQGNAVQFAWSPVDWVNCPTCHAVNIQPPVTTLYTLTVQDAQGCTASDQIWIEVESKATEDVFVPNTIKPGASGTNGFLTVYAGSQVQEVLRMEIFDRWGGLIFRREHFAPGVEALGWDGSWRGQAVAPGVYVYAITVTLAGGSTKQVSGDVTVLR